MDLELTQTQTELTAWRLANGKAHIPKPLKQKIIALNRRFSTGELSRAFGISLATLSYWKRQAATPEVKIKRKRNDFVELQPSQLITDTSHVAEADDRVELFLRNGTIRAMMSMQQFQVFLSQEGAA